MSPPPLTAAAGGGFEHKLTCRRVTAWGPVIGNEM